MPNTIRAHDLIGERQLIVATERLEGTAHHIANKQLLWLVVVTTIPHARGEL